MAEFHGFHVQTREVCMAGLHVEIKRGLYGLVTR